MANEYSEFNPEVITRWEQAVKNNPNASWNENKISEILPLLRAVPNLRIGKNQSLLGFSLVCINDETLDLEDAVKSTMKELTEPEFITESLQPLIDAKLLTLEQVKVFIKWFYDVHPSRNQLVNPLLVRFTFKLVSGETYELMTDSYAGYRDINLHLVKS